MKTYILLAFVITFLSGCADTPVTIKNKLIDKDFVLTKEKISFIQKGLNKWKNRYI